MKIDEAIFNELEQFFNGCALNPALAFKEQIPIRLRIDVLNFIEREAPEILEILSILVGIVFYCAQIKICLPEGYLLISFVNGILTYEKNNKNKKVLISTSYENISHIMEQNMRVLIQRGFPPRSDGVIVLNEQSQ